MAKQQETKEGASAKAGAPSAASGDTAAPEAAPEKQIPPPPDGLSPDGVEDWMYAVNQGASVEEATEYVREQQSERDAAIAKREAAKRSSAPRSTFHVAGPGSVFFMGKNRGVGTVLELTEAEAASLGAAVAPGATPAMAHKAKAKGGSYRVTEFGSICKFGRFYNATDVIELTAEESKAFADRIEPV